MTKKRNIPRLQPRSRVSLAEVALRLVPGAFVPEGFARDIEELLAEQRRKTIDGVALPPTLEIEQ